MGDQRIDVVFKSWSAPKSVFQKKLSIIDSADKWLSLREIRNIVTHEYPDNEEEIADGLNQLSREAHYLSSLLDKLIEYIKSRKLLD